VTDIFSPMENKILEIIDIKRISIGDITERLYRGVKDKPVSPNSVVSDAIVRINNKCEHHRLKWFLNGVGAGRGGRTVWRDKR